MKKISSRLDALRAKNSVGQQDLCMYTDILHLRNKKNCDM